MAYNVPLYTTSTVDLIPVAIKCSPPCSICRSTSMGINRKQKLHTCTIKKSSGSNSTHYINYRIYNNNNE